MAAYDKIKALNWSSLHHMETSAHLFNWRAEHPRPETSALSFGSAFHVAILQPDRFEEIYAVQPASVKRTTKAGKAWAAEQGNRTILNTADAERIVAMASAVTAHAPACDLLEDLNTEIAVEWMLEGVPCKGRMDALSMLRLVDLKTTRDLKWFANDAAKFAYHGQLAWYRDGAVAAGMLDDEAPVHIIAVESAEPYDVAAFIVPTEALEAGRRLYRRLFFKWLECNRSGIWPGRHPSLDFLELPAWALDEGGPFNG